MFKKESEYIILGKHCSSFKGEVDYENILDHAEANGHLVGMVSYSDDSDVSLNSFGDKCSYAEYIERTKVGNIFPSKFVAYFPVEGIELDMLADDNVVIVYSGEPNFDLNEFLFEKKSKITR